MGLTNWATGRAVRAAHVLVVEVPGHWLTRMRVEQAVRERGWHLALSPADADLLVVCGQPVAELEPLIERVWEQMPGPRARSMVTASSEATAVLDRSRDTLLDLSLQRGDARSRPTEPDIEHGGMDRGDHDDMEMAPGGISLAEGGEDRDGLQMDVLHVAIGPILPHWPAGLVLRCSLQGDVIVSAEAEQLDGTADVHDKTTRDGPAIAAAVRLDNAGRLLALAGWTDAATRAERLRDDLFLADDPTALQHDLDELRRRVARSRPLWWSLRRIRWIDGEEIVEQAWPLRWAGDVYDRLLSMLDRAATLLSAGNSEQNKEGGGTGVDVPAAVPQLVWGLDVATARLVVASLDLDPVGMTEVQHA